MIPALAADASARTHAITTEPVEATAPVTLLARLAHAFDIDLGTDVVDRLVRLKLGVRDLFASATERLAAVAHGAGFHVPDLTILTSQPLGDSPSTWATSGFGWREDPIRKRRKWHSGADVRAKRGTPVAAAGDGVVVFAGRQGGYGNVVYVDHGGGVITRYGHLNRILVKKDTSLVAGQTLGQVGSTGRATGPHLHFEVRLDGRAVDPATAMTVGELQRESPEMGHLAAFSLTPEMQALEESELDPPRSRGKKSPKGPRPERPGRTKHVRPVS
ncbi:MAG: M23 family metallopeptidase [Kofleriaceae bacterium]|nr:M23 family metallopeptidase [Kofleriaceae bacterium]